MSVNFWFFPNSLLGKIFVIASKMSNLSSQCADDRKKKKKKKKRNRKKRKEKKRKKWPALHLESLQKFLPWANWWTKTKALENAPTEHMASLGWYTVASLGEIMRPRAERGQFMPFQQESIQVTQSVNLATKWETAKSAWNVCSLVGRRSPFLTLALPLWGCFHSNFPMSSLISRLQHFIILQILFSSWVITSTELHLTSISLGLHKIKVPLYLIILLFAIWASPSLCPPPHQSRSLTRLRIWFQRFP